MESAKKPSPIASMMISSTSILLDPLLTSWDFTRQEKQDGKRSYA